MTTKRKTPAKKTPRKSPAKKKAVGKKVPVKKKAAPKKKAATTTKPQNLGGRPTKYNKDVAARLCAGLAIGQSLRTVCAADDMPCVATVFNWFDTQDGFLEQYERAKEQAADAMAEDILDIADDGTNDWMEKHDKDGNCIGYQINGEHVQRSRLRVDARKFLAMKLKPKKYGDKLQHTGADGDGPVTVVTRRIVGEP